LRPIHELRAAGKEWKPPAVEGPALQAANAAAQHIKPMRNDESVLPIETSSDSDEMAQSSHANIKKA
jgi:hypothetical protein